MGSTCRQQTTRARSSSADRWAAKFERQNVVAGKHGEPK